MVRSKNCELKLRARDHLEGFLLCFSGGERKEEIVFPVEKRKILLLPPIFILGRFCFMLILKTSESD